MRILLDAQAIALINNGERVEVMDIVICVTSESLNRLRLSPEDTVTITPVGNRKIKVGTDGQLYQLVEHGPPTPLNQFILNESFFNRRYKVRW